ncbi:MAG: shikimate kinase [Candidatus Cloacimonetes bacterium]|jgi:shikimate kinase|nr:shikimate kinase [Candidatus Cloacimonadota bacterium]MDY0324609.1 shikimate kinase [Candidatus Cloacimonadaceae bacterium]
MKLYIIGFSSAGKSTLARSLAASWNIPYWDTDEIFVQEHSQSIADYVLKQGWEAFRKAESDILLKTQRWLSASESSFSETKIDQQYQGIVACGGGIVESEINRAFLASQRLLWLNPPWERLLSRIRQNPSAFCAGKSEQELYKDFRRRCILYRDLLS